MRRQILKLLLDNQDSFFSGQTIASLLKITRTAVHLQLASLKTRGYKIISKKSFGYKLLSVPDFLDEDFICVNSKNTYIFNVLDSTQDKALEILNNNKTQKNNENKNSFDEDNFTFVLAKKQESARGRRGNVWEANSLKNIYLSAGFLPNSTPEYMQKFTLYAGMKICQFLREKTNCNLNIKWPNDIVFNQKKLAGILVESQLQENILTSLVLGIGLNVLSLPEDFPEEVSKKAVSILELLKQNKKDNKINLNLNLLALELINVIKESFIEYIKDDKTDFIVSNWHKFDALKCVEVQINYQGEKLTGTCNGIDKDASLIFIPQNSNGKVINLVSGEVSVKNFYEK